MSREYDCGECGLCCINYGGEMHVYEEDLLRWRQEKETKILARLRVLNNEAATWQSVDGEKEEGPCHWLTNEGGYRCSIYQTRPLVCRHFANGGSACRELRAKYGLPVEEVWRTRIN